jgi:hypothetical protein
MTEGTICPGCKDRGPHSHACHSPVTKTTIMIASIRNLNFYCKNCGRVADTSAELCNPELLTPEGKALFLHAAYKTGEAHVCKICGQPVSPPGHICDPKELPYDCEYCKKSVQDYLHMCQGIIDHAKFICQDCGRIAVHNESLCAPVRIP